MIKLKRLVPKDESQKYVEDNERVRNSLNELCQSEDYKSSEFSESITMENFTMIAEWVSLKKDDLYKFVKTGNAWYSFVDKNDVKHEIRLIKGCRWEIKLWFIDDVGKPNYSPPNVYSNFKYDTAIFNTYTYILINELIPHFFNNVKDEPLYLPATDKARFRLYKITLNNHLDKNKYQLSAGENPNELIVNQKK